MVVVVGVAVVDVVFDVVVVAAVVVFDYAGRLDSTGRSLVPRADGKLRCAFSLAGTRLFWVQKHDGPPLCNFTELQGEDDKTHKRKQT